MFIGIPGETQRHEHRVDLTPQAVRTFVERGHQLVVERSAGTAARFSDHEYEGAGVVTSRADVHYVVTEHGAVNLFGRNLRERAELLIQIADPRFQDDLAAAARERKLLP